MTDDWYEALNAWQRGEISADDAIRICAVADIWELWELALGSGISGIDIKLGNRDDVAAAVRGKRQIDRGEFVDIIDLIAEVDLIVHGVTEEKVARYPERYR